MPWPQTKRSNNLEGHIGMFSSIFSVAILSFWRKNNETENSQKYTVEKHGFFDLQSRKFWTLIYIIGYTTMCVKYSRNKEIHNEYDLWFEIYRLT